MRKILAAAAVGAALLTSAAWAVSIDSFFGNTVVVTTPDGAVTNYYFNADNTVTASQGGNQVMSGAWEIEGETLCITPAGGAKACYPIAERAVGDTWTLSGPNGDAATLTLNAGR